MAVRKYLARDFTFQTSATGAETWFTISGLNSWSWGPDANEADTTTFDNAGWGSSIYTSRAVTVTLEGFKLTDPQTGVTDGGQTAVESSSYAFGFTGYRDYRILASGGIGSIQFEALASMGETGGGVEDVLPWSAELKVQGKPVGTGIFAIFG